MKKQTFLTGALILGISSVVVRLIGFAFRIYISNSIGAEGMGVYSLVMSIYGLTITLCTAGIGLAVSSLVAEQLSLGSPANARRVLRRAVWLSVLIGGMIAAVLYAGSEPIANLVLKEPRTALSLKILAPGLPFLSVSSCVRGYFVARRRVGNPATGQILEQGVKMAFIIGVLGNSALHGIEYSCAVIVLGITIGEVVCLIYSALGYALDLRKEKGSLAPTISGVTGKILAIIGPIGITAYVRAFLRLAEDVLIMEGLRAFSGVGAIATGTYGILKGMVMPLLTFPLALLTSFVITLTPEISRLNAAGRTRRLEKTVSQILQYTSLAGILVVCVFMSFSYQLGIGVYGDAQVGEMLRQLSFLCPFMCLESVVVSILVGLGEQASTMRYGLLDCGLRILLICLLIPSYGTTGFLWMVIASNLFTSILNLRRLLKITRVSFDFRVWIFRPLVAATASSQIIKLLCNYFLFTRYTLWFSVAVGLAATIPLYFALLLALGCFSLSDFAWIKNQLFSSNKPPKVELEKSAEQLHGNLAN